MTGPKSSSVRSWRSGASCCFIVLWSVVCGHAVSGVERLSSSRRPASARPTATDNIRTNQKVFIAITRRERLRHGTPPLRYPFKTHPSCPLGPTWRNVTSHWNRVKHHECHRFYRAFWVHPHFPVNTVSAVDAAAVEAVCSASWITQKPYSPKRTMLNLTGMKC